MRERRGYGTFEISESRLLKLRDVPFRARLMAFRNLVDSGSLTEDEIAVALDAVLDPGDLSARAA